MSSTSGESRNSAPVKASHSQLDATIKRNRADTSCHAVRILCTPLTMESLDALSIQVKSRVMGHILKARKGPLVQWPCR